MINVKKVLNRVGRGQFFRKFLVSYMAILGISAVLITMVYFRFCNVLQENAVSGYQSLLEQSAETLDQDMTGIDDRFYSFSANTQITKVINSPYLYEKEQFREIMTIFEFMPPVETDAPSTYLIIPRQNVAISSSSTFRYSVFYGYCINHEDISAEVWEEIVSQSHYRLLIGGRYEEDGFKNSSYLYHVRTLPVGARAPSAIVLTTIAQSHFDTMFQWTEEQNCTVCIMDEDGTVLYVNGSLSMELYDDLPLYEGTGYEELYLDSDKYLYAYTTAGKSKLRLIAMAPAEQILAPVRKIQYHLMLLCLLFLIAGLVLAAFFSRNNSHPLEEIVSMIEDNFSEYRAEGINSLHAAISDIIANDAQAKRIVEHNLPYIQAEQRKRLLMGELIINSDHSPLMLENIKGSSYNVLVMEIIGVPGMDSLHSLLEFSMVKEILRECEREYGEMRGYFVDLSTNLCAMIIASDEVSSTLNAQHLEKYAREIFMKVTSGGEVFLKFAAGKFQGTLSDVCYSYVTARELLDSGILQPNQTVIWEKPETGEFAYNFSLQIEQRLISTVSTGNREELKKVMEIIYSQNFENCHIPDRMVTRLYDEINGVIHKLLSQLHGSLNPNDIVQVMQNMGEIKKHQNILPPEQMFQAYQDTLLFMCYCVKPKQKSRSSDIQPRLATFMQEHYVDPAFGLAVLAEHFGFSEIYMSQLFKENMGSTFSDYLERLRIDTACTLLRETNLTIADISQRAGYYSPHAFRRAFKRVTGVLPTDYRALG